MAATRRALVRSAPAATLVSLPILGSKARTVQAEPAQPLPEADRALLALEAELDRLRLVWDAATASEPEDDGAIYAACTAWWQAAGRAAELRPQTGPGLHAKAGILARVQVSLCPGDDCAAERRLSASLIQDIRANAGLADARAAAAPNGDAFLIATCERFDALESQVDGLYRDVADDDARDVLLGPIEEQQRELLAPICDVPAVTLQGLRARARAVARWDKDFRHGWRGGSHHELAWSIVRDLIGGVA